MKAKPLIIIDSRHTLYDYRIKLKYKYNTMLESAFLEIQKMADCLIIFAHKDQEKNEYFYQEFLNKFGKLDLQCLKLNIKALSELQLNQECISIVTHDYLNFMLPRKYDLFYFSNVTQNAIKKQHLEEQIYNSNQQFTHISHFHQVLYKKQINTHIIGYYFYPKKLNELFKHNYLKNSDKFTFIPIDLRYYNKVILTKVRIFFHKLLDIQKFTEINIPKAEVELMLNHYNQFIKEFKVISIDNIEKLQQLINRDLQTQILDEMLKSEEFHKIHSQNKIEFKTPYYLNFDNTNINQEQPQTNFPLIVKTKSGALTVNCHIMAIVVSKEGLSKVLNAPEFKCDLIFQEIINHESMIYKVYNLGNDLIIQKRRSIPNVEIHNFKFQEGFYIFDSQLDLFDNVSKCLNTVNEYKQFAEEFDQDLKSYFYTVSKLIKKAFNIQLFGFDVVGDFKQMKFYIIDINHFPGYKNMENIKQKFDNLLLENIQ